MEANQAVLFEELPGKGGNIGLITLNRPEVLNSLNLVMIQAIYQQLEKWEKASAIKGVVIKASPGRAFCAGGDLSYIYKKSLNNDPTTSDFFRDEYALNRAIFHYPKPYIAFLDGITMGGGVGISLHGSHCIATERFLFAMPETAIGFYPDVGGTYFLPRLQGSMGYYLGLTGTRLKAQDACSLGLIQHVVPSEKLTPLLYDLAEASWDSNPKEQISALIKTHEIPTVSSHLMAKNEAINVCFRENSIEEIIQALGQHTDALCQEAATMLERKSPTSLKVTLKALQEGKTLNFDDCMSREFQLTCQFLEGHDFKEGIRALIIDKDQRPRWQPATLSQVSLELVDGYFAFSVKS